MNQQESQSSSPEKPNKYGIQPQEAVEIVAHTLSLSIQEKEALATILNKIDLDPVMSVKVRPTWVPPVNIAADHVLDDIATWRMPQGRRRDVWDDTKHTRRLLFHFKTVAEIAACQKEICQIRPYCFGPSSNLVNIGVAQVTFNSNIFADVVVINKTGVRDDDVFDYPFFEVNKY